MDPNESGLSSYFQHLAVPPPLSAVPPVSGGAGINVSPTNGMVQNIHTHGSVPNPTAIVSTTSSPMAYSNTVPPAISTGTESGKKKRGRPRKYATPEEAAAAKRLASASNPTAPPKKKQQVYSGGILSGMVAGSSSAPKKFQLNDQSKAGTTSELFKPHVINVADGEDVGQKIMCVMQQNNVEMCVLSASGSISMVSLRQPATSGGSVSYQGRYDLISLSGSYVRTEHGGITGGLSVVFASNDGQMIGGGVGGPLTAFGPIQVIAGTFVRDNKKDNNTVAETSPVGRSQSPLSGGGTPLSGGSFRSPSDSYQNYGGGGGIQYMNIQ